MILDNNRLHENIIKYLIYGWYKIFSIDMDSLFTYKTSIVCDLNPLGGQEEWE